MTFVSIKETRDAYNKDIKEKLLNFQHNKNANNNFQNIDFSDDLIFVCFLLGNDFLPHFPSIDIHHEGLDELVESYIKCLLSLNSSLINIIKNDVGETIDVKINNIFFCMMLEDMGIKEDDYFYNKLYSSMERNKRKNVLKKIHINRNYGKWII